MKNFLENEITTIFFPNNIPDDRLENLSYVASNLYTSFLPAKIEDAKIFTKEQYEVILRMIRMVIHCKHRIGNENILFNEFFVPLDLREKKNIRHNKKIIDSVIDSDEYFYITETGFQKLRQIPPSLGYPVIIEVKQIPHVTTIKDCCELEKIIERGKTYCIQ